MLHSIQEILKIINNRITSDLLWFFASICLLFIGYFIGLSERYYDQPSEFEIVPGLGAWDGASSSVEAGAFDASVIFGSRKGKYFYYKGCGGDNIAPKNLVYYKSETEAQKLGKTLYQKCQ